MLNRWSDFDRSYSVIDELRRRMGGMLNEYDTAQYSSPSLFGGEEVWPRINVYDKGSELLVDAEVPGLSDKDVQVTIHQDVLTIEGERRVTAPQGYGVQRQERGSFRFTRSFGLPCAIDAERSQAIVKDGILTVVLPKAPEAQPRKININAE
jgi:HSP20 family protein